MKGFGGTSGLRVQVPHIMYAFADECEFFVKEKGSDSKNPKFWMFNFNGLCAPNDYEADSIKKSDGIVQFNICGKSNDYCLPSKPCKDG